MERPIASSPYEFLEAPTSVRADLETVFAVVNEMRLTLRVEECNETRRGDCRAASTIGTNGLFGGRSSDSVDQDSFLTKYFPVTIRIGRLRHARCEIGTGKIDSFRCSAPALE